MIGFIRESSSDNFFNAGVPRRTGDQLRINAVPGDDSERLWNLTANCHSERSKAKSKNPAKLPNASATGFLDFARNDVTSFTRGVGVLRAAAQEPFAATPGWQPLLRLCDLLSSPL